MNFPFTTEQFLSVFKSYNQSVWPIQILFNLLALLAVALLIKKSRLSDKAVSFVLSFFWLWMGVVYHILFFTTINPAAYVFGAIFTIQAILLFYVLGIKQKAALRFTTDIYGVTGLAFIVYAIILYPITGYYQGHVYPASPTFGLPCPTTIFTLGILLWSEKKMPLFLVIIPLAWSVIGFLAAMNFGIKEDIGLLVAAIVFIILIVRKNATLKKQTVTPA